MNSDASEYACQGTQYPRSRSALHYPHRTLVYRHKDPIRFWLSRKSGVYLKGTPQIRPRKALCIQRYQLLGSLDINTHPSGTTGV